MEPVINQIHKLLLKRKLTVSVAESCTGGILSNFLTYSPGSSKYFVSGIVAYSNEAKARLLSIPRRVIAKNGAVSKQVALLMAKNVRKIAQTDFGIGVTGIAGPSGATPEKPVGMVFIAVATKTKTTCKKFNFRGSRATVRKTAALKVLELLAESI
ncbi:MAG: CinA family protein [Candidatus Omnitrophica bacterium]|nr:CinA family protein [Candidatus Omnitrophota bacterium]